MEEYKARFDKGTSYRKPSKEYGKAKRRYDKARTKLDAGNPSPEDIREFKAAQQSKLSTLYADVRDPDFKRIQYNRYADDFVVGVIGSKQDALVIKEDLRQFLSSKRQPFSPKSIYQSIYQGAPPALRCFKGEAPRWRIYPQGPAKG